MIEELEKVDRTGIDVHASVSITISTIDVGLLSLVGSMPANVSSKANHDVHIIENIVVTTKTEQFVTDLLQGASPTITMSMGLLILGRVVMFMSPSIFN